MKVICAQEEEVVFEILVEWFAEIICEGVL